MHHTHTPPPILTPTLSAWQRSGVNQRVSRFLLSISGLILIAATHAAMANEHLIPEGSPGEYNTSASGTLILRNTKSSFKAVQLDADMEVVVSGLLAQMTLTQTFRNTSSAWMQARYLFPLPETAAVQSLLIETNGKIIHGKIMPRIDARNTFEAARDSGQITGLLEQQRPNLFTMDVATVAPNSEVSLLKSRR